MYFLDVDECAENRHNCDPSSSFCVNEDGGFRCDCAEGYQGMGGICVGTSNFLCQKWCRLSPDHLNSAISPDAKYCFKMLVQLISLEIGREAVISTVF